MVRSLAGRAAQALLGAFVVTSFAFLLVHALPGDATSGLESDPELVAAQHELRSTFGLDQPLAVQYPAMLAHYVRGDFGESFIQRRPVSAILADVLPNTLVLMVPALLIGIAGGAVVGTWQAARTGGAADAFVSAMTLGLLSVPELVIALLVGDLFAVKLHWFPGTGVATADASFGGLAAAGDVARHAFLPALTLALVIAAVVARYQRVLAADVLTEEFVRAARARGAPRRRVLWRHVLRRTAPGLAAVLGLLLPAITGGAALVESVFGWSGAGATLVSAVARRDYPVVLALVTISAITVSVASAAADFAAEWLDPARRKVA